MPYPLSSIRFYEDDVVPSVAPTEPGGAVPVGDGGQHHHLDEFLDRLRRERASKQRTPRGGRVVR